MKKRVVNTIRNQVYQLLKEDICNGEYQPGQWLQEVELASRFSVSRSPVREALHQLASDGLVVEIPNKGIFVKEFTPKDIEEIFDLRVMLENYAIGRLKDNLSEEGTALLKDYISKFEQAHADNDLKRYIKIDSQFHELLVKLSQNDLLVIVYERIHSMIQQFRTYSLSAQLRFDNSLSEHRDIVTCILEQKCEKAQQINCQHLQLAKEQILIYLNQSSSTESEPKKFS